MKPEDLLGLAVPVAFLILLAIESRVAARQFEPVRRWAITGTLFFLMVMAIGALTPLLLPLAGLETGHALDLSGLGLLGILPGLLVAAFLLYWFHRAEHRYDWLWRATHQLHHSALRVDMLGAYFAHPLEVLVKVSVSTGSSIYLLGLTPVAAASVGVISALLSLFGHWNIRTPRWLGYVIPRPESHCLHHERDRHGRNYGDLPLWDQLFGTFENPREEFDGNVGFDPSSRIRLGDMLLMRSPASARAAASLAANAPESSR
ncbi:MAG: sterol desaturase family protein [Arenimonas sp.]|jgi:sterol desaturase/sphingolipid hydroxylase (fatty acid hydroxylase superfamily)